MSAPTAQQLDALKKFDTPTMCNAIEMLSPERRGHGFTRRNLHCIAPDNAPIVAYARTASIRAGKPAAADQAAVMALRASYYSYVADGDVAKLVVMQDLDSEPGVGAFWGEVNTTIHRGLGCDAVITNGSVRDLDEFAPGFSALAGVIGPSHAFVHVVNYRETVEVAGMTVHHDDLIHADQHGAVVVPLDVVADIPDAVDLIVRREAVILEAARAADFNIDKLLDAMSRQSEIH